MLVDDYFDNEYLPLNPGLSDNTIRLYRLSIRAFGKFLGKRPELSDLTNANLAGHMRDIIARGRSIPTANKDRAQLMAIVRAARDDGFVDKIPRVKAMPEPEKVPTALTRESVSKLMDACDVYGYPEGQHLRCVIAIQYATGERIGAVQQLRWQDIAGGVVTFRAETRKGRRKANVRELPEWVLAELDKLPQSKENLFPWCPRKQVFHKLSRVFRVAGVARPRWKSSHLFRSTHATEITNLGHDATRALGHSRPETTAKHYLDPRKLKALPQLPSPKSR